MSCWMSRCRVVLFFFPGARRFFSHTKHAEILLPQVLFLSKVELILCFHQTKCPDKTARTLVPVNHPLVICEATRQTTQIVTFQRVFSVKSDPKQIPKMGSKTSKARSVFRSISVFSGCLPVAIGNSFQAGKLPSGRVHVFSFPSLISCKAHGVWVAFPEDFFGKSMLSTQSGNPCANKPHICQCSGRKSGKGLKCVWTFHLSKYNQIHRSMETRKVENVVFKCPRFPVGFSLPSETVSTDCCDSDM